MKTKDYLIRIIVAIAVVATTIAFIEKFPIVENLLTDLAYFAIVILIAIFSIRYGFKNFTFGIIYGLLLSIAGYTIYLIIILFNQIFG